jgi:SAM-dependent methyltransferase
MTNYARMYRFGITPWERYATAAASSIAVLLDREETRRSRPPGRALDLGCGRGLYTPELARRGWEAVGIDDVPAAGRSTSSARPLSFVRRGSGQVFMWLGERPLLRIRLRRRLRSSDCTQRGADRGDDRPAERDRDE